MASRTGFRQTTRVATKLEHQRATEAARQGAWVIKGKGKSGDRVEPQSQPQPQPQQVNSYKRSARRQREEPKRVALKRARVAKVTQVPAVTPRHMTNNSFSALGLPSDDEREDDECPPPVLDPEWVATQCVAPGSPQVVSCDTAAEERGAPGAPRKPRRRARATWNKVQPGGVPQPHVLRFGYSQVAAGRTSPPRAPSPLRWSLTSTANEFPPLKLSFEPKAEVVAEPDELGSKPLKEGDSWAACVM